MNKYEKAFNHLREHAFDTVDGMIDIKELVERATPKKARIQLDAYIERAFCPECGCELVSRISNYCRFCGQALDWRVEDDNKSNTFYHN